MPSINLSDIQKAAEETFGDIEIALPGDKVARLMSPLMMDEAPRARLKELAGTEYKNTDEFVAIIKEVVELRCRTKAEFTALKKALGSKPAGWVQLFLSLNNIEELGEA